TGREQTHRRLSEPDLDESIQGPAHHDCDLGRVQEQGP
ncbi:MAG: hypothetical protein ACJAV2_003584, partial [Myxococcota bacterium]